MLGDAKVSGASHVLRALWLGAQLAASSAASRMRRGTVPPAVKSFGNTERRAAQIAATVSAFVLGELVAGAGAAVPSAM